jgi:citrate lyase alpha subunit
MINLIKDIKYSHRKNKRFKVRMDNDDIIHFGLKTGSTFIDHHNVKKRDAYINRHLGNKTEEHLIDNLIISPSLLSMYLLWGPYTKLQDNIMNLNKLLSEKYN